MKIKYLFYGFAAFFILPVYGQEVDAKIVTESDRSIEPARRIYSRPNMVDTTITSPVTNYPLMVLQESTAIEVEEIKPANIRLKPQLSQLYNTYLKIGGGSNLQALGEVYFNSVRSRKYHWGIHGKHHSEWGKIKDYAPSQYDQSFGRAFGKVEETRYSYGGELDYKNQGLHYYGFENPDASRDSIKQRYQSIGFNAYFDSHKKDSATLNYKIGLDYRNFMDRKPEEDSLKDWRGKENYVGLKTNWQYNGSNNILLSNLSADLDFGYNDYRYGIQDTSIALLDTGIVSQNTVIQLRPITSFYGLDQKLQFKVGGELALDIREKLRASLYPIAEVKYSLFNDIFIPYIGIKGGLKQQRFEHLAAKNEFIRSNLELQNEQVYHFYFGIKGTVSSRISFKAETALSNLRNHALFINDTVYSSGNKFGVVYDTLQMTSFSASISYQQNEKLKLDLLGSYHIYLAKNNPFAWNMPQFELVARGVYNVSNRLITTLDFTLESGRYAQVFDSTLQGAKMKDSVYYKSIGVIPDANIGVEFRYSKRLSLFANFNNIVAQNYKRWFDYPVNGFQAMIGGTFRF